MRLLGNDNIRTLLHDYYEYEANQRQFQDIWFRWQLRHLELSAGIVSLQQETHIQDTWMYFGPEEIEEVRKTTVEPDAFREAVDRFRERQPFIDWLPQTRAMQLLQMRRNESMLEKANAVLAELQGHLDSIER